MDNFSAITLRARMRRLDNDRRLLRQSKAMLSDQTGDYAKHHQLIIDTLSELILVVGRAIKKAESIGPE